MIDHKDAKTVLVFLNSNRFKGSNVADIGKYWVQRAVELESDNAALLQELEQLRTVKWAAEELILFNDQVGLDIRDDGADNCGRRTYDLLIRKLQTLVAAKGVE